MNEKVWSIDGMTKTR